ncbi:uncharacterized protein LOC134820734 isoform X2 [Bolinopsis microptera]|uniref:uncharacterized protein LOC134820734 isoform X2 n=1 Tax=Bolinopsis microptera TaxID=2820187 RepID=UPI00307A51F4
MTRVDVVTKMGLLDSSSLFQGPFESTDRNLYSDYSEISPWNTNYQNRFKRASNPTWKYLSGTMPDFHQIIRGHTTLTLIFSFLRSLGMWLGISNPFLGLCVFVGICLGCWPYGVIYVTWCVLWVGVWAFYLGVPDEQIYNGLYPSQGVLLGFIVYRANLEEDHVSQLPQLVLLIPFTLLTLLLFQAIGIFLVKVLRCTPLFLAPALVGFMVVTLKSHSTYLFTSPAPTLDLKPTSVDADNIMFFVNCDNPGSADCSVTASQFGIDLYKGMSYVLFTDRWESIIPLTIGLLITSPISCLMAWIGAVAGAVSAILLSPLWTTVSIKLLIFPSVFTMMSISGLYFVIGVHSVIIGLFACFFTTFLSIVLNSYFELFNLETSAPLAAYIVIIILNITGGAFRRILQVELMSVTTPEDHLRRYWLSQKIITDLKIRTGKRKIAPSAYKNIEKSILPILLCAYAKHGFIKKIKELIDLGADLNASDYDGRCALHLACAENREELVHLLLQNQADIHQTDNFQNNALSSAILHGHFNLAKYIYKKGGRLRLKKSQISSMLCYMVAYDDLDRLKIWLDCGADPNSSDYDNRTPLHIAYSKKNDKMINFLKRYAPKKEVEDRWGKKPSECYGKTVQDLQPVKDVKKKIDQSAELMRNRHQHGKRSRQHMKIDPVILEGIIRHIMRTDDKDKIMALLPSLVCEVVAKKERDIMHILIKENVLIDLNVADYDLRTPLHIACATGDIATVKTLCWNNANINAIDRFGYSPLLEACKSEHDDVCEFLLDQGAQLCLPLEMQVSELCWAVFSNDFEMIQRLVNAGINIHSGDYDGRTCLAVAFDNKNKNMMKLLKQYIDYSSISSYWSSGSSSGSSNSSGSCCNSRTASPVPEEEGEEGETPATTSSRSNDVSLCIEEENSALIRPSV